MPDLFRASDLTDLLIDWNLDGYQSPHASLARDVQALALTCGADVSSNPYEVGLTTARGVAVLHNRDYRYNQEGPNAFAPDAQSLTRPAKIVSRAGNELIWEGVAYPAEHTHQPRTVDTATIRLGGSLNEDLRQTTDFVAVGTFTDATNPDSEFRNDPGDPNPTNFEETFGFAITPRLTDAWINLLNHHSVGVGPFFINNVPFAAISPDGGAETLRAMARGIADFADGWALETHDGKLSLICPRATVGINRSPVNMRLTRSPYTILNDSYVEEALGLVRNEIHVRESLLTSTSGFFDTARGGQHRVEVNSTVEHTPNLENPFGTAEVIAVGKLEIRFPEFSTVRFETEDNLTVVFRLSDFNGFESVISMEAAGGNTYTTDNGGMLSGLYVDQARLASEARELIDGRVAIWINIFLHFQSLYLTQRIAPVPPIRSGWSIGRYGRRELMLKPYAPENVRGEDAFQHNVWHRRHLNRAKNPLHYARVIMPLAQPTEELSREVAAIHPGTFADVEVVEPNNNEQLLRKPMVVLQADYDIRPGVAIPRVTFHCLELPESYESERYIAREGVAKAGRNTVAYGPRTE